MGTVIAPSPLWLETSPALDALYTWILEQEGKAIFAVDEQGLMRATRRGCTTLWGFTAEELEGKDFRDLLLPEDQGKVSEALASSGEDWLVQESKGTFLRKDGVAIPGAWKFVRGSGPGAYIGVARPFPADHTGVETLEAAVRELASFKRALDEHAIVAVTDAKGKITYVNDKFCAIAKYEREELLGQDHRLINSGTHPKTFFQDLWKTIKAGKVWKGEIRNRAKDGTYYWVDTTIVPFLDEQGVPSQYVSIRVDITQKKGYEELQRQTQKLESLGVLAGGIAHDFNNLLTTILGNCNLSTLALQTAQPAEPYLDQIEKATLKAANLTRQMLAYAGKGTFHVALVDLNRLIRDMTELLQVSISKNVTVRFLLDPGLALFRADPTQMQQVVMNLVTNASEAIGPEQEGHITIRTGERDLREAFISNLLPLFPLEPGHYVILEVTDNGCGMTPDTVKRIFDPFYSTKFTGRGLGLSAMAGILRGHGGSIKVYSEPGHGTSMKLFFPVGGEESLAPEPVEVQGVWQGCGTLLVVDDDPGARAVAVAQAEAMGFKVVEAVDGAEALAIFERRHAELTLVLMDVTMPRLGGQAAFQAMKLVDPAVPVVLTSGFSEQEVLREVRGVFPAGFLPKPYQRSELQVVLRKALAQA